MHAEYKLAKLFHVPLAKPPNGDWLTVTLTLSVTCKDLTYTKQCSYRPYSNTYQPDTRLLPDVRSNLTMLTETKKLHVPDVLRRPLMLSGWYKATAALKGPAQRRKNLGNFIISPLVYFIRSSAVLLLSWTKQLRIRATAGKQTSFGYFTMESYHSTSSFRGAVQLSGCSTWLRYEFLGSNTSAGSFFFSPHPYPSSIV